MVRLTQDPLPAPSKPRPRPIGTLAWYSLTIQERVSVLADESGRVFASIGYDGGIYTTTPNYGEFVSEHQARVVLGAAFGGLR